MGLLNYWKGLLEWRNSSGKCSLAISQVSWINSACWLSYIYTWIKGCGRSCMRLGYLRSLVWIKYGSWSVSGVVLFNQVYWPAGSETESDDLTVWDGNICTYLILHKINVRTACGLVAKSLSCVKSCWDVATSWYRYLRVLAYCFMNILTRTVNTQYTGLWILTWHALILCNTVKLVRNSGHCLSIMAGPNVLHNILCTHMLHKFIWKCNCLPMRLPCVFYICTSSVNASYS